MVLKVFEGKTFFHVLNVQFCEPNSQSQIGLRFDFFIRDVASVKICTGEGVNTPRCLLVRDNQGFLNAISTQK